MVNIPITQSGGATPYISVAANNTEQSKKDIADFVCTGTNDEATILLALAALRGPGSVPVSGDNQIPEAEYMSQGGTVYFMSGEFYLDNTLTISLDTAPHHVRLDGDAGATLYINNTNETPGIVFEGGDFTPATHGYNRPELRNLTIVGNFDELNPGTPHCGDLVQMNDVAYPHVHGCHLLKAGRDGFHMTTPDNGLIAPQNRIIAESQFLSCARHGIFCSDSHDFMITDCQVEENARLAGSGGAGVFLQDIVGGTLINVMSEDNDNIEYNPDALDFEIIDSSLNMIGCDSDGGISIDTRGGLNFKMDTCHFAKEVTITGSNSVVELVSMSAPAGLNIINTPADQGSVIMTGGRAGGLHIEAGTATLSNVLINGVLDGDVHELSVTGGYATLGSFTQLNNASFVGVSTLGLQSDGLGVLRAVDSISVIGCGFEPDYDFTFSADSSCRILFNTAWNQLGGTVTFDQANASQNGIRLRLDCNFRSPSIVIDEIDYVSISGSITGGTIDVSNCNNAITLCGLIMGSFPVVSLTDCTNRGVMTGCTGNGSVDITNCPFFVSNYFEDNTNPGISVSRT